MKTIFSDDIKSGIIPPLDRAKIITIEGIDGSGKTTIVNECTRRLNDLGYKATNFNASSDYNEFWKVVNSGLKNGLISSDTNQMFHNVAFITYLNTIFNELISENDFVLTEWYVYGKMVLSELYTHEENPNSKLLIKSRLGSGLIIAPNHSFFIDVDPIVALERIKKRAYISESKEEIEMLKQAYNIWQRYIDKYGITRLDGNKSIDEISEKVLRKVIK